jgi:hypothetical protein
VESREWRSKNDLQACFGRVKLPIILRRNYSPALAKTWPDSYLMNGWAHGHGLRVARCRILVATGMLPGVDDVPCQVRIATRADAVFEERQ